MSTQGQATQACAEVQLLFQTLLKAHFCLSLLREQEAPDPDCSGILEGAAVRVVSSLP